MAPSLGLGGGRPPAPPIVAIHRERKRDTQPAKLLSGRVNRLVLSFAQNECQPGLGLDPGEPSDGEQLEQQVGRSLRELAVTKKMPGAIHKVAPFVGRGIRVDALVVSFLSQRLQRLSSFIAHLHLLGLQGGRWYRAADGHLAGRGAAGRRQQRDSCDAPLYGLGDLDVPGSFPGVLNLGRAEDRWDPSQDVGPQKGLVVSSLVDRDFLQFDFQRGR